MYHNVIIIGIKWTINIMRLNHPETILTPELWKKYFPLNRSLAPKGWGWATFRHFPPIGDLPDPRIEAVSPVLTGRFFITSATWQAVSSSCCCCSVAQLCLTLWNPVDCSMPGFPVLHYLLEFDQTHVHWISDAIQPSHLLLPPFPPALSLSQHQGIFQSVSSLHQVAKFWSFIFSISPS